MINSFDHLVKKYNTAISKTHDFSVFRKILSDFLVYKSPRSDEDKRLFFEILQKLKVQLIDQGLPVNSFWTQEIDNIKYAAQFSWKQVYRDKGMAENIIWLKENPFKGKKIIIWAQNAHIFKEVESWHKGIPGLAEKYNSYKDKEMGLGMGAILNKKYGDKLFSLGVISYQGKYSSKAFRNDFTTVEKIAGENYKGLAKQIHQTNIDYAILPFDSNQKKMFRILLNASGHNHESIAKWGEIFDAVLFSDKIEPLKIRTAKATP